MESHIKLRALCVAGLAVVALPVSSAMAGPSASERSITSHLRSADRALKRVSKAVDEGNDAGIVSGLKAATRETSSALTTAKRVVKRDPDQGVDLLSTVTDQQEQNIAASIDAIDGGSSTVVTGASSALTSSLAGRSSALAAVTALSADDEAGYGDSLTQLADDTVGDIAATADAYGDDGLTSDGTTALTTFLGGATSSADAIVAELVSVGGSDGADLDPDALGNLGDDIADATDALNGVTGLSGADAAAVTAAKAKLADLTTSVSTLADPAGGDDSGDDDSGSGYGYGHGGGYGRGPGGGFGRGFGGGQGGGFGGPGGGFGGGITINVTVNNYGG